MKKRYIFLIILLLLIGVPLLRFLVTQYIERQDMINMLKSPQSKSLIEEHISSADPDAFTDEGIIKSYEIDYSSVKRKSAMGFTVKVYINDDKEQFMRFLIASYGNKPLISEIKFSHKLNDMLMEER